MKKEDSKLRLIETAVRPLGDDAESKSAAKSLLEILWEERPDQAEAALARWDACDAKKRPRTSGLIFWGIIIVVSAVMLGLGTVDLQGYWTIFRGYSGYGSVEVGNLSNFQDLGSREKLVLGITEEGGSKAEAAKELWDSDPKNAAYFMRYSGAYLAEMGKPPADFLEQARAIDPDNAYFFYWAASIRAKEVAKPVWPSKVMRSSRTVPAWSVMDEPRLDQALTLLHGGSGLTNYQSYDNATLREKISLLPQHTPLEYFRSSWLLATSEVSDGVSDGDLARAIAAKAWLYGERGETAKFLSLKQDADAYLRNVANDETGAIFRVSMAQYQATTFLKSMGAAALKLGLATEVAEIRTKLDLLEKLAAERRTVTFEIGGQDATRKLSFWRQDLCYLANRTLHPPILTDADAKPGRMMDYDFVDQIGTYGIWTLLCIVTGAVALYRFRGPRLVRHLSARMGSLLRPVDWVWLATAGIAPFIYLMAIRRLTTLGGTELNIMSVFIDLPYYDSLPLPVAQFAGMFLMTLILAVLLTRWRLAKRVGSFGFGKTRYYLCWIALLAAALSIPVLGKMVLSASGGLLIASWVLLAIPAGWLLAISIRAMTQGATELLHLTTVSRVLVPTLAMAMLFLLLATPYFIWSRQRWFEQDPLSHLDARYPARTKFEYEIAVQAQKELREALGE